MIFGIITLILGMVLGYSLRKILEKKQDNPVPTESDIEPPKENKEVLEEQEAEDNRRFRVKFKNVENNTIFGEFEVIDYDISEHWADLELTDKRSASVSRNKKILILIEEIASEMQNQLESEKVTIPIETK